MSILVFSKFGIETLKTKLIIEKKSIPKLFEMDFLNLLYFINQLKNANVVVVSYFSPGFKIVFVNPG
jgi:CxxC motif-containing protein